LSPPVMVRDCTVLERGLYPLQAAEVKSIRYR
jgi:hypothetical protein